MHWSSTAFGAIAAATSYFFLIRKNENQREALTFNSVPFAISGFVFVVSAFIWRFLMPAKEVKTKSKKNDYYSVQTSVDKDGMVTSKNNHLFIKITN